MYRAIRGAVLSDGLASASVVCAIGQISQLRAIELGQASGEISRVATDHCGCLPTPDGAKGLPMSILWSTP